MDLGNKVNVWCLQSSNRSVWLQDLADENPRALHFQVFKQFVRPWTESWQLISVGKTQGPSTICWTPTQKYCSGQLVGGWTNPVEKYARQIGSSPQVGVKIKNIWNHHPVNQRCKNTLARKQMTRKGMRFCILLSVRTLVVSPVTIPHIGKQLHTGDKIAWHTRTHTNRDTSFLQPVSCTERVPRDSKSHLTYCWPCL